MLINHDREKLFNAIIFFLKKTKYCGKTKLFKLLYFLDFMHFKEAGKAVTGLDYFAWDFGPVPQELFFELKDSSSELTKYISITGDPDEKFTKFRPLKKFDDKYFTKRELKILENIAFIFKNAQAVDMKEVSHLPNHPWDRTIKEKGDKKRIDYLLAIDDTKESLSIEEVKERIREKMKMVKAFNG